MKATADRRAELEEENAWLRSLMLSREMRLPPEWGLHSRHDVAIMGSLISANRPVSRDTLIALMYRNAPEPKNAHKILSVRLTLLRARLQRFGVTIPYVHSGGLVEVVPPGRVIVARWLQNEEAKNEVLEAVHDRVDASNTPRASARHLLWRERQGWRAVLRRRRLRGHPLP